MACVKMIHESMMVSGGCNLKQIFLIIRRSIKRKLPYDPALADELPVYEYPSRREQDNVLYVWGLGEHGALGQYLQKRKLMTSRGDPRFRTYNRPLRLRFGEQNVVTDIAAGFGFSAFSVKSRNSVKVYGTGLNTDSQLGCHQPRKNIPLTLLFAPAPIKLPFKNAIETKIIGLSAGRAHLAICTDLEGVFTLGNNAYGQCGRRIIENEKYEGSSIIHKIQHLDGVKIKSVECGQDHTLFLTEKGTVYSCGWGADGQTGLGIYHNQSYPTQVLGDIKGENIIRISAKCDCVLALNDKGEVFGWGNSEYCQIYEEQKEMQQVNQPVHLKKCNGFGKVIDVAAAGSFCMMLNDAGDVFTWGFGILGRGPQALLAWKPEVIPPILFGRNEYASNTKVTSIYCGLNHSAALTNNGDIYTWGKNKGCCLGLGDKKDQFFPLRVALPATCKKLALGVDHTLALCRTL